MLGIKDVFKRNTLSFNFYLLPIVRKEEVNIYFRKNVSSNYPFFSGVDGTLIEHLIPILTFFDSLNF